MFDDAAGPMHLGEEAFSVSYPRAKEWLDLHLAGDCLDARIDINT